MAQKSAPAAAKYKAQVTMLVAVLTLLKLRFPDAAELVDEALSALDLE
jgi:hypothetical protein